MEKSEKRTGKRANRIRRGKRKEEKRREEDRERIKWKRNTKERQM